MKFRSLLALLLLPWLALQAPVLQAMDCSTPPPKKVSINKLIATKFLPKDPIEAKKILLAEKQAIIDLNAPNSGKQPDLASLFDVLTFSSFYYFEYGAGRDVWLLRQFMYVLTQVETINARLKAQPQAHELLVRKTLSFLTRVTFLACLEQQAHANGDWRDAKQAKFLSQAAYDDLTELLKSCGEFLSAYAQDLIKHITDAHAELVACDAACNALTSKLTALEIEKASIIKPSRGNSKPLAYRKKLEDWQGKVAAKDEEIQKMGIELSAAQNQISRIGERLGTILWKFKEETVYLANNKACAQFGMAILDEKLIIDLFTNLEKNNKNAEFFKLCTEALKKFKSQPDLYDGLIYTLQQYICCAYYGPKHITAKGPAWEIATALFLYDSAKENSCGNILTINGLVRCCNNGASTCTRELDIITERALFELKGCQWNWECNHNNPHAAQERMSKNIRIREQILQQQTIAQSRDKQYVVISKERLDAGWSNWFRENGIAFVDPNNLTCDCIKNIAQLYQKPYFIA